MNSPRWLTVGHVQLIHELSISQFGGAMGVRELGLLDSAVSRPVNKLAYDPNASLSDLAGSYGFGIARNHPFIDGNKRTAFGSAATFLELNGHRVIASEAEVVLATVSLASGEWDEATYAFWLKENCSPI